MHRVLPKSHQNSDCNVSGSNEQNLSNKNTIEVSHKYKSYHKVINYHKEINPFRH